jgi:hypothetical protein
MTPRGQEIFFSTPQHPDQLWGPPTAPYTMGTNGFFPGVNWQGHEDDHSLLSTAERDNFTFTPIIKKPNPSLLSKKEQRKKKKKQKS